MIENIFFGGTVPREGRVSTDRTLLSLVIRVSVWKDMWLVSEGGA